MHLPSFGQPRSLEKEGRQIPNLSPHTRSYEICCWPLVELQDLLSRACLGDSYIDRLHTTWFESRGTAAI
jgi:hypothetical protein